jgi:alpha-1,3-rhamnosyl/mannosyltransferase
VRHYKEADLFVFPSSLEGFGIALLEAMAFGLPIVTSRVPPLPDVAGDAALYAAPGDVSGLADSISRLLRDGDLRRHLGAEAARRVRENFTWDRVVAKTLEVFRGRDG